MNRFVLAVVLLCNLCFAAEPPKDLSGMFAWNFRQCAAYTEGQVTCFRSLDVAAAPEGEAALIQPCLDKPDPEALACLKALTTSRRTDTYEDLVKYVDKLLAESLKDPTSVIDYAVSTEIPCASLGKPYDTCHCVRYNAKNSHGAYGGRDYMSIAIERTAFGGIEKCTLAREISAPLAAIAKCLS
ncbi:hypothetical protein HC761_02055 [bacterium]|nr:hypothetical protein [bacterium]